MRYNTDELNALREMMFTEGWELIGMFADSLIDTHVKNLLNVDANDTAQIAALQGEIRGLKRVFDHVRYAVKKLEEV